MQGISRGSSHDPFVWILSSTNTAAENREGIGRERREVIDVEGYRGGHFDLS
jgi:hypothetical protein